LIKRGQQLPQSKLTDEDVRLLRKCVAERERLRKQANELSNKKLAEKFDVHVRTVEKALQGYSWIHV
jgi:hypothetical protein